MGKTTNEYHYPTDLTHVTRVAYVDSPAHKGRLQYAVDFIVPEGTPILAALEGIVVDIRQDSNKGGSEEKYDQYGNYIEIQHEHDEYSIYEHIKENGSLVKVGDKVETGQVIGYSGKTGWIAHLGPHLHFDVHQYTGKGPEDYQSLEIVWKSNQ